MYRTEKLVILLTVIYWWCNWN